MSQDDQSLSKAIEASLKYDHGNDVFEEVPMEERIRKGDRFVRVFIVISKGSQKTLKARCSTSYARFPSLRRTYSSRSILHPASQACPCSLAPLQRRIPRRRNV